MMLTRPCYFVNNNNADNFNKWLKELEFKRLYFSSNLMEKQIGE